MSTTPLFTALIDDAALFPPGNAPMLDAVREHARHRSAWYGSLVGPFLCPASRLEELAGLVATPSDVRVVVDTGAGGVGPAVDAVASDGLLVLRGVEVALRAEPLADAARRAVAALDAALGGPDDEEPAYVEVPRAPGWREALEVVADSGYRAKLRTGDTFPSEEEVATFVLACLDLGLPFKCTAGLHRAVRHTTPDGIEQHGFLNILVGVATALEGGDTAAVASALAERDLATVTGRVRGLDDGRARGVRRWFSSFGSCSVDEPLADLVALELVKE